jgi:predicted nucleotidyltransferase
MATQSKITPVTVKRKGQDENAVVPEGEFSSAGAIRNALKDKGDINSIKDYVPEECFDSIKHKDNNINELISRYYLLICAKILSESPGTLEMVFSAGEGLGSKMKKEIRRAETLEGLISGIKSKRYARTRIQRLLTHTLTGLTSTDFREILREDINYARVLAFNEKGAALLKKIRGCDREIQVITNIKKQAGGREQLYSILRYDILASDIYNLISGVNVYENSDYSLHPFHKI